MVFEYLRSMAAVAMTGLEYRNAHPDNKDSAKKTDDLSCLYFGYGAGSLPRYMANSIAGSQHVAIDLDEGVVTAAHKCNLLSHSSSSSSSGTASNIQLHLGDALAWQRSANNNSEPFDAVFVDIFDGENLLPKEFYSKEFLNHVYQNHLGGLPGGMIIHNFFILEGRS